MNKMRKPNSMLIELVIVILFFSISAGIILQLFVAASNKSLQNSADSAATFLAEDVAERLAASADPVDVFFEENGWQLTEEGHVKDIDSDGRKLQMVAVDTGSTQGDAGDLDLYTLSIIDGNRTAVSLPISRYIPKEATP